MYSRLIKHLLDSTGVKNLIKIREFEYLLNPLRDINQLELDSYWAGDDDARLTADFGGLGLSIRHNPGPDHPYELY